MIDLSYIPANIQTEDTVLYNDWSSNLYPVELTYRQGDPVPSTVDLEVRVKDIFPLFSEYGATYKVEVNFQNVSPLNDTNWVSTSFEPYTLTENNTFVNIPLSFNEVYSLSLGTYHRKLAVYIIKHKNSLASVVSVFLIDIYLNVVAANDILTSPLLLDFNYPVASELFPALQDVQIQAPESVYWAVIGLGPNTSGHPQLKIETLAPDVTISVNPQGVYGAFGHGSRVLKIGLASSFSSAAIGNYSRALAVHKVDVDEDEEIETIHPVMKTVPVSVSVIPNQPLWADTQSLSFSAIRNVQEAQPKTIMVLSGPPASFAVPPWLSAAIAMVSPSLYRIKITPIPTSNIGVGNYIGVIKANNSLAGITIPVNYNVTEEIGVDFGNDEINFALDEKFINLQSNDEGVFYEVEANVVTYTSEGAQNQKTFPLKVPIFKGKGSFNVGRMLQRMIHPENEEAFLNGIIPKPAHVYFSVYKKLFSTQEIIGNIYNFSMKYVAGRTPIPFYEFGLLAPQVFAKRITKNSIEYFNFATKTSDSVVNSFLYKNGIIIPGTGTSLVVAVKYINSMQLSFRDMDISPGDQIEHQIKLAAGMPGTPLSQRYICFPESEHSNHVVWMDDYKLRQIFEFTGSYRIETEFEVSSYKQRIKLVSALKKISTESSSVLVINTGWIPKDNQVIIENLVRSNQAWLLDQDMSVKFRLVPIQKKIVNEDSKRMLIDYDVEFAINPEYDEKNNSF